MAEQNYLNEEWRCIKGYEGLYEISSFGRVRSLNYRRNGISQIMKLTAGWNKYIKATLVDKEGNSRTYRVHRLVAENFLPPPPPDKTMVNHKSGQKQDNRVSNLEYVDAKENANNPATKPNYHIRYHREGEFARRSAGQRRRFAMHPEDLEKMWVGYRKYQDKRKKEKL